MIDPVVALKVAIEHLKDSKDHVGEIEFAWDQSQGDQINEFHIVVRPPMSMSDVDLDGLDREDTTTMDRVESNEDDSPMGNSDED